MTKEYILEALGTFVFLTVILKNAEKPNGAVTIGLTLASCIAFVSEFGPSHLNPAVSLMFALKEKQELKTLVPLVMAQIVGAVAAANLV